MKKQQRDSAFIVAICILASIALLLWLVARDGLSNEPPPFQDRGGPAAAPVVSSDRGREEKKLGILASRDVPDETLRPLFDAIFQEESYCGFMLEGDGGITRGPYHISQAYWQDACEYGDVDWDYHTHIWSHRHCKQVMIWYWQRYGAKTDEERARIHNGGPRGMSKESTKEYWRRIQAKMEPKDAE
ncbi:hypothetical protein LCGC14_1645720 [marine sediment metagenome]|uniref:Transglycosylase SLT domain-containing protein n=1 Tax=marine sediment metagenome TaxID=412755 RepID=A0A0F9IKT3_9ZZZZ